METKLKQIGKALLLPVSIFPIAAILNGIGYSLENLHIESLHFIAIILKHLGNIILTNMPMIFSIGVAYELSNDKNGFSAFNGLYAFLLITTLLSVEYISIYKNIEIVHIDPSFKNINNQFVGIISGLIASFSYNRAYSVKLIYQKIHIKTLLYTTLFMGSITLIFYFAWPFIYHILIVFGTFISGLGPIGAGIYAFLNRLLVPFGLHHPLNSVFWFDVIGINDIGDFWASHGTLGRTGMYQAGFFPIMMFGLPAAALAMYRTVAKQNRKKVSAFLLSAAIASFFTGVTEPLEFSFMFLAPGLYFLHSVLTGICVFVCAQLQWIAGFSFSAGLIDYILSFNMPLSHYPFMLLIVGIFIFIIYYFSFKYCIQKFNILTIGRVENNQIAFTQTLSITEVEKIAFIIIESVGGINNIKSIDCCITRLRIRLFNPVYFDANKIKETGATEYKQFHDEYQIIYGPEVDLIMNALEKQMLMYQNKS